MKTPHQHPADEAPTQVRRSPSRAWLLSLGLVAYEESLRLQEHLVRLRMAHEIPDTIVLLEHPPVLTLGRRARSQNVLVPSDTLERLGIAVHATDRGGDVTYHGPGQLVGYPIIHLEDHGQSVRDYVHRLEEVMISVLASYGAEAGRRAGFPGVWVGSAKIGFIGVHVSHWVTRHGFSLNVQPDLGHFSLIHPCGLQGVHVTSVEEILGRRVDMVEVRLQTAASFRRLFDLNLEPIPVSVIPDYPSPPDDSHGIR